MYGRKSASTRGRPPCIDGHRTYEKKILKTEMCMMRSIEASDATLHGPRTDTAEGTTQ